MKTKNDRRIWVIRPGRKGSPKRCEEREQAFIQDGIAGLCDDFGVGDMLKVARRRDDVRGSIASNYPDMHPSAVSSVTSNLIRLAHDVKISDWVLCPSRIAKVYRVGIVKSAYRFDPKAAFQHQMDVKWISEIAKDALSIKAQQELGAARLFFECKRYAPEVRSHLSTLKEGTKKR